MQPDTENENREYNTNEIADIVAIAVSTVRKYCTILEKAGYLFTKNANGYRIFKGKGRPSINRNEEPFCKEHTT